MNYSIFELSVEDYKQLLDSGMGEKLIKDFPKNEAIFKTQKNIYTANQCVFELILNIAEGTGADAADLYEFFEENYERIISELDWFGTDLLNKDDILDKLEEEVG